MASNGTEYTVLASAPFNTDFADIVLRTPDKVDFNVHSQILRLASTVFDAIVSIPSLPTPDGAHTSPRPVIDVTEDSATLDCLMRCCYPTANPVSTDVGLLDRVLVAAHKYDFELATAWATGSLQQLAQTEPLAVYTVACVHQLEELASKAAVKWKGSRQKWRDEEENFEDTPAGASYIPLMAERLSTGPYLQLLQYLRGGSVVSFCTPVTSGSRPDEDLPARTATQYPFNADNSDIIFRSSEGHDFRVHSLVIEQQFCAETDGVPRTIWSVFQCSPDDLRVDDLPVVTTSFRWDALSTLLRLCYPTLGEESIAVWGVDKATSQAVIGAFRAATRHHFKPLLQTYRARLLQLINKDPLAIFCVCAQFRWEEGMLEAARELALRPSEVLCSDCFDKETLPATMYHALLKHYHTCQLKLYQHYSECTQSTPVDMQHMLRELFQSTYPSSHSHQPSHFPHPYSYIPYPQIQHPLTSESAPYSLTLPQLPRPSEPQSMTDSLDFSSFYGGILTSKISLQRAILEIKHALQLGRTEYKFDTQMLVRANERDEKRTRSIIESVKLEI